MNDGAAMQVQLVELLTLISSGCMGGEEILQIAGEAAQAYADPRALLEANADINFDDSFPIPLGEWVVVGSLLDTVLFQADSPIQLFQEIRDAFVVQLTRAFGNRILRGEATLQSGIDSGAITVRGNPDEVQLLHAVFDRQEELPIPHIAVR